MCGVSEILPPKSLLAPCHGTPSGPETGLKRTMAQIWDAQADPRHPHD